MARITKSRGRKAASAKAKSRVRKRQAPPKPDDDIPEMTAEHFAKARPAAEAMPGLLEAAANFRARGRPRLDTTLTQISIRVDPMVLEAFKAAGDGWQQRMRAVLAKAAKRLEKQRAAKPRARTRA